MSRSLRVFATVFTALFLMFAGCTDDDPDSRPAAGGTGGTGGTGSSNDDSADADGDTSDTSDDADEDVLTSCDLEPSDQPGDARYPCCHTDLDCKNSDADRADEMVCYYSECTEGGQGTCRVPPEVDGECWSNRDCSGDQVCPWEQYSEDFDCEEPLIMETPEICTDP